MTPAEFTAALDVLGWSRRHLVELLGCDTTLANRWASGRARVPTKIAQWLTRRVKDLQRDPPPEGPNWRVRHIREAAE